jgi:RNA polymerase sigma factor (sigma-70 family)
MAARPFESLIRRLCSSIEARDREGVQDSELLARFVGQRDEAAFELLVRRHAALVLGVCRRIVGDEHHAEDAFQAAFLTLARKAGSIRQRGSLSSWLCKVAFRSALAAQASAGRSARREQPMDAAALPAGGEPADQAVADEFRRRVDEEVSRLPEKHRLPVRLCYL